MYAPQSTISGAYQCLDQYNQGVPYAYFSVTPVTYLYTNAHLHDNAQHPISSVTCNTSSSYSCISATQGYASASGVFSLSLRTTLIGQAEALSLYCSNGYSYVNATANYAVGYNDVYYNDHPEIWVKIGGSETGGGTGHGTTAYNRYMKSGAAYGLYYATQNYLSAHPEISQVCTNDMALPFGGKFDLNQNWTSPHSQHDRGSAADVAGTGSAQCANAGGSGVNVAEFISYCVANGASSTYSFNETNHAHCGFEAPVWPH